MAVDALDGVEERAEELLKDNDGLLTDEQMADLLNGEKSEANPEDTGDKGGEEPNPEPEEGGEEKSPDDDPKKDADPEKEGSGEDDAGGGKEEEPVILAKDGKHTIEYQKLVDARDATKEAKAQADEWKQIAEEKEKLLEQFKQESEEGAAAGESEEERQERLDTLNEDLEDLMRDYPDAGAQIKALLESNKTLAEKLSSVEATVAGVEKGTQEEAVEKHFNAIRDAHEDFETVLAEDNFNAWLDKQPSFMQDSYRDFYEHGTTEQVIGLVDLMKEGTEAADEPDKGKQEEKPEPKGKSAADVKEEIEKAEKGAAAPESLSDVPGSSAHHDEGEALLEMTSNAALAKMEGKTPEQINALLERVL